MTHLFISGKKHGMSEMGTLYLVTEDGKELEVILCTDSEALYSEYISFVMAVTARLKWATNCLDIS